MPQYDLAKRIFSRAFPDEKLVPQAVELWRGDFPLPDPVAQYYREFGAADVEITGYGNSFFLPSLARLWEHQVGYRSHALTGERIKEWDNDWLVIADSGGDPFIYSRGSGKILFAMHGAGEWRPTELFADLPQMVTALAVLGEAVKVAGDDLTDEDDSLSRSFIETATEKLSRVLDRPEQAGLMLRELGWTE